MNARRQDAYGYRRDLAVPVFPDDADRFQA